MNMKPFTLEMLERRAQSRPPGYVALVMRYAKRISESQWSLTERDHHRIQRWVRSQWRRPGDLLHRVLRWCGYTVTRTCGCGDHQAQMNAWGWRGSLRRLPTIARWLIAAWRDRRNANGERQAASTVPRKENP